MKAEGIARGLLFSSAAQLTSKGLGLLRNLLMASCLGVSVTVDNFNIVNGIAMIFFSIIADSFMYAAVPLLTRSKNTSPADFLRLAHSMLAASLLVGLFGGLIGAGLLLFAGSLIAPTYSPKALDVLLMTFWVMLPGCFTQPIRGALGAAANASSNFSLLAWSEALCSCVMLVSMYVLREHPLVLALAFSAAHVTATAFLGWCCRDIFFRKPSYPFSEFFDDFKRFFILAVPFLVTCAIHPLFIFCEKHYGVNAGVGTLASLAYAMVLIDAMSSLPQFGRVLFPLISSHPTQKTFNDILKLVCCYAVPLICFTIFFAHTMVPFFFGYGVLTEHELAFITRMVVYLSPIIGFGLAQQCAFRFCYAAGHQRFLPVCRGIATLAAVAWLVAFSKTLDPAYAFSLYYILFYGLDFLCIIIILHRYSINISKETVLYIIKLLLLSLFPSYLVREIGNPINGNILILFPFQFGCFGLSMVVLFVLVFRDTFSQKVVTRLPVLKKFFS